MEQTAVSTMKALVADQYGPAQNTSVREMRAPQIKPGFLLVRMHAAAVNPFDYKLVTGAVKDWVPITFPYIPGMDGAGVVADVGDGVEGWRKGDALLGMFPKGAFAQYALISANEKRLARKPDGLDFEHAAALPEASLTALTMLRAANVRAGQKVLIIGATGGLGLFATQLVSAQGADAIATGKAQDVDYLRGIGAKAVIDYGAGDAIVQTRAKYPRGVDTVIDVVNSGDALLHDADALREGGALVSSLSGPEQSAFLNGIRVSYIELTAQKGDLEDLARQAADGKLRVEIGKTYDLSDAGRALSDLGDPAKHIHGKLVVRTS